MVAQCDASVANLAVAKTGGRSIEDAIAYIFEKSFENQKMEHPFIGYNERDMDPQDITNDLEQALLSNQICFICQQGREFHSSDHTDSGVKSTPNGLNVSAS